MPTLFSRLKAELSNWKRRVPRSWRIHFEDVELDFSNVDPSIELLPNEAIWPQESNAGGPDRAHLFKAFRSVRPEEVRVVVFGNDPYTRLSQATGCSFEQGDVTEWAGDIAIAGRISPSLKSILAAAAATSKTAQDYPLVSRRVLYDPQSPENPYGKRPEWLSHIALKTALLRGDVHIPAPSKLFSYWAGQGVLWMNRTLTYTKWDTVGQPGHRTSNQTVWKPFTQRVIEVLVRNASRSRPVVFALWGGEAGAIYKDEISPLIRGAAGNAVSAVRTGHPQWVESFFGGDFPLTQIDRVINPLEEINKKLKRRPIKWL